MARRFYKSELTVSGDPGDRAKNYLGILLSFVVLIAISSIIVAAIVIVNPDISNLPLKGQAVREAISLEDALLGELYPSYFSYNWRKRNLRHGSKSEFSSAGYEDELLFEDSKNIKSLNLNGKSAHFSSKSRANSNSPRATSSGNKFDSSWNLNATTLVSNSSLLASIDYQGYEVSPSKRFLLIWTNRVKKFRHSFVAKYFIYDIKLDLISLISTSSQSAHNGNGTTVAGAADDAALVGSNSFEHLDSASEYLNDILMNDGSNEFARFQRAEWFPSTTDPNDDSLILVQNNDLFLLENVAKSIENYSNKRPELAQLLWPIRLTFTGKSNEIFNGISNWLYEEEILSDSQAYQVSPKSTKLAYMSFNDSQVDLMPYSIYGPQSQLIPKIQRIRYPKAGRPNPQVTVRVIDLKAANKLDLKLELPADLRGRQHYIVKVKWLTDEKLFLSWLNRQQNESYFLVCAQRQVNWICEKNFYQTSNQDGWLDMTGESDLIPLNDHHYLSLIYKDEGERVGKFKHVAKLAIDSFQEHQFLTSGQREVVSIDGVDEAKKLLYFTSTIEMEPGQRQAFQVNYSNSDELTETCLTCRFYPDECKYNFIKMSPSTNFFVFECHGPGVPRFELHSSFGSSEDTPGPISSTISGRSKNQSMAIIEQQREIPPAPASGPSGSLLWSIEENQALKEKIRNFKAMPLSMRLKVPIANTNYSANVHLFLPPQLGYATSLKMPTNHAARGFPSQHEQMRLRIPRGASAAGSGQNGFVEQQIHQHLTPDSIHLYTSQLQFNQQYPMVVEVYGGPSSQKVDYRFAVNFGHYMASSKRTVYAMIDGRGSGYQGTRRLYELYHKFGTVEIEDQIEVAAYLVRNFSFIDPSKVAIWGWSYGGYASAMALAQSNRHQQTRSAPANVKGPVDGNETVQANAGKSGAGVFECAVSVAPVTNWIYYDTAYTERYMSSPFLNEQYDWFKPNDHLISSQLAQPGGLSLVDQFTRLNGENNRLGQLATAKLGPNEWVPFNQSAGLWQQSQQLQTKLANYKQQQSSASNDLNARYRLASLIENIYSVDRKRFLLVHGTADDNVHFQQSIQLMKRLINRNILFESRLYPDQDHGIANKADKLHLGSTLSNFFSECFDMAY